MFQRKRLPKTMKDKKITVTIGIPAFNEEANIGKLLQSIFEQKKTFFNVKSVILVSDASTDKTVAKAKSFRNKKLKIIQNPSRKGQIYSQNLIFSLAKTDVVVILEADTILAKKDYLKELILPIYRKKSVGLVEGYHVPIHPCVLIEKVLFLQLRLDRKVLQEYKNHTNWIFAGRGGKAFSKNVYRYLVWPSNVPEDVYAHIWSQSNDIKIKFSKSALTYYRLPHSINDFVKERRKIESGRNTIKNYFPQKYVDEYYKRPAIIKYKWLFHMFLTDSIYCIVYLGLKLMTLKMNSSPSFTDMWLITKSTKVLNSYEK